MNAHEAYHQALGEADKQAPDGATVLQLLNTAHEAGDHRATYALANCHRYGQYGLQASPRKANRLLRLLAKSNVAEALFDLAYSYDVGELGAPDERKAFSLYMRAALLGDRESCFQVAEFFREGTVVPHDSALARAWKERSKMDEALISPPSRVKLR